MVKRHRCKAGRQYSRRTEPHGSVKRSTTALWFGERVGMPRDVLGLQRRPELGGHVFGPVLGDDRPKLVAVAAPVADQVGYETGRDRPGGSVDDDGHGGPAREDVDC